jgi:hypothetical protein
MKVVNKSNLINQIWLSDKSIQKNNYVISLQSDIYFTKQRQKRQVWNIESKLSVLTVYRHENGIQESRFSFTCYVFVDMQL